MAPTDVEPNNSSKKPGKGGKPLRQPKVLYNTQQPPPAIRRGVWFSYPAAPSLFVTVTWPRGPQSGAGKRYKGGGNPRDNPDYMAPHYIIRATPTRLPARAWWW